jgi:hypothetical protein
MLYDVGDVSENFARLRLRLKVGGSAEVGCQLTASAMACDDSTAVYGLRNERRSPQFKVFTATSFDSARCIVCLLVSRDLISVTLISELSSGV